MIRKCAGSAFRDLVCGEDSGGHGPETVSGPETCIRLHWLELGDNKGELEPRLDRLETSDQPRLLCHIRCVLHCRYWHRGRGQPVRGPQGPILRHP